MGAMLENMNARLNEWMSVRVCCLLFAVRSGLKDKRGQGTTEYAILVGVLVVIAIIAVVAFRGKLQDLWNAISDGINSL
jgi:Flp pilus assembly pilin Flp